MQWNVATGFDMAPPTVHLSRYRGNIYLAMANVPDGIDVPLRFVLYVFSEYLYNIPLKWEPHGASVAWGKALLQLVPSEHRISLLWKGVCLHPASADLQIDLEWHGWVSPESPNARLVWRSQLRALIVKSIWFALSATDVLYNIRSLV